MINIEALVKGQEESRERKYIEISAEEFKKDTKNKVLGVVAHIQKRFRITPHYGEQLVRLSGDSEYYEYYDPDTRNFRRIEQEPAQKVALEVMDEFGRGHAKGNFFGALLVDRIDTDKFEETLRYPSATTKGLVFERTRVYQEDGQTLNVSWKAVPRVASVKLIPF